MVINLVKRYWGIILIILLSFWSIKPLFISGFFPIHDDTQVARVFEMTKSLRDGMFPVRWVADLGYGYGYPIFNFYAPLSYYVGSLFNLFGFDSLISVKFMIGVGVLLSAISMYFLSKEFWGKEGAVLSALLYMYAPFHALDIYVRGDIAEVWAYGCFPFIFYGIVKTYKTQKFRYACIGAIAFASTILSHNLTALMITPFVGIVISYYCLIAFQTKKVTTLYYLLFIVLNGLLLSAFYWVPVLFEIQFTNVLSQIGGSADFRDHFVCLGQLWDSQWGFGGSIPGCIDGISFRLGKPHLVLSILAFGCGAIGYNKYKKKPLAVMWGAGGFLVSIFLLTPFSRLIWETVKPMSFFQYPWRFLIMCSFFSSFVGGYVPVVLGQRLKDIPVLKRLPYIILGVFIVLLIVVQSKIFTPQYITFRSVSDYTNNTMLYWKTSKISDEYMPKNFKKPKSESETINSGLWITGKDIKILSSKEKTQYRQATIQNPHLGLVSVHLAYFPAWHTYIDNKEVPFSVSDDGIRVSLQKGTHILKVRFEQTFIEKVGNLISLIGLFLFVPGIMKKRKIPQNT